MPSIEENINSWNDNYTWRSDGNEWSLPFGNEKMQWYGSLLPRIQQYIPTGTILEIAPGHGRWTQFLIENAKQLIAVDLSESCIDFCKKRFNTYSNVEYYVNDGKSLPMISDNSIDFLFSFDSLVHVEIDIIEAYLKDISKKLTQDGLAFIHHSNLGEYTDTLNPNFVERVKYKLKIKGGLNKAWRAPSVTHQKFKSICEKHDLFCLSQELINWGNPSKYLIDCISVFCRKDSTREKNYKILRNGHFMHSASLLRELSSIY